MVSDRRQRRRDPHTKRSRRIETKKTITPYRPRSEKGHNEYFRITEFGKDGSVAVF